MKIAFVTDNDNYSGIGRQNYAIYSGLKKQGVDIDFINLYIPARYKGQPEGKQIKSNILDTSFLSFLCGVIYIFPHNLNKILKEGKYTHVVLGHQFLAYLYPSISKINIKKFIIIHDLFLLYNEYKNLKDIIYSKIFMRNLDKFENVIFISDYTKNDYIKYYNNLESKNYKTIYQGIDKQDVKEDVKESFNKKYDLKNKKIFINVGSEDIRKNIITYLKIAKSFNSEKDYLFIRVGKKSIESENFIKTHKINNVLYLKGLSDDELFALYSLSNAVISTSLYEGYGRQIFEGYLYSKYIITSNVSDVKKIFNGDTSVHIVSNPYEIKEYCKAINNILDCKGCNKTTDIQNSEKEILEYYNFLGRELNK